MKATDRHKLIDRIKTLEELTDDERAALLGLLRESKTYGLVWEDKPEEVEERLRTELPVLKEVKSRAIISDNADAPNHILIEGDNLEALTTLAYTHEGKIDVIYIDPPYNTGNKDFVYNDSYVDNEDSYRHSKWLSFMSRRLRIAKRLLSERGVVFISIDDNEISQLKLLCDEIFGQISFLGNVIWEKTDSPRMDVKGFYTRHDYILVYRKMDFVLKRLKQDEIPDHYNKVDENGKRYYLKPLRLMGGHKSESLYYGIPAPDGTMIYPKEKNGENGCWRWSQAKIQAEPERIEIIKTKNGWSVNYRIYADNLPDMPVSTIWPFSEVGSTRTAKTALTNIIQQSIFSYPKPNELICRILQIGGEQDSIILDFFAGSGTTLHAVMQLNAVDGGKRQCILCTNNENGICENVTYERNKRVIQGYTKPNGEAVEGLYANNLRYYRTDFVGRRRTPQNMRRLMLLASDMLCIKENLYTEHDKFGDLPTLENGFRYFSDGKKQPSARRTDVRQMLIVYNEEAIYPIVDALEDMDVAQPIIIYVFSPGNDAWNAEFESVADKVRLTALPAAIYNAYKRVLPKAKDTLLDPPTVGAQNFAPADAGQSQSQSLFDFDENTKEGGNR